MEYISQHRKIPVKAEYDVCVIGGSCTGVFAAVRASQMGMKVAIVERQNAFGGAATSSLVHIWHSLYDTKREKQVISGLTQEIIRSLQKRSAVLINEAVPSSAYRMNTEELKIELDLMVSNNKITPFLHTTFCDAIVVDDKIKAIIIENKDGAQAICAKFFIDCSGDGDLCRNVGVEHYTFDELQPPTMCAKIYGIQDENVVSKLIGEHYTEFGLEKDWGWRAKIPNIENVHMHAEHHVFGVNCASADQLTYSEMHGREQVRAAMDLLRKYHPNGEKITLLSLPSYIGIRDTYHIKSVRQISDDDILYGVNVADAIGYGTYPVDVHHGKSVGITLKYLDGTSKYIPEFGKETVHGRWRKESENSPTFYQISFSALIPKTNIQNLLFAGRMVDAQRQAYSALRVMVNANQMGEATGVAAALAILDKVSAVDVDIKKIQDNLRNLGAIIL